MKKLIIPFFCLIVLCMTSACADITTTGSGITSTGTSTTVGDPFSTLPSGCTDQGPVDQTGMNEPVSMGTGLMPASSLGEDHTNLNATIDLTAGVLAQTLLCHGKYAILIEDNSGSTHGSTCLAPTWKYVPAFSWNDFAGDAVVHWTYKCVEPGDGTFLIHTDVVVNVRRTDIGQGTVWVEYLFIADYGDQLSLNGLYSTQDK